MQRALTPAQRKNLEIAAHHEAGHAVACLALDVELESVTIDCNGGLTTTKNEALNILLDKGIASIAGHHLLIPPMIVNRQYIEAQEKEVKILMAGEEAQRLYDIASIKQKHVEDDRKKIEEITSKWGFPIPSMKSDCIQHLRREASLLILWNKSPVDIVARELIKNWRMTGARVEEITSGLIQK